ncbi:DegT/DnrJ/EryC1/StrS family aminotransferase, partial [Aeromonas finlandensis]|uniref:DegT/DnrJ/EryC1/StrS family aminotransferase n=1 Tax=Aeromonas finlandensis TaxID=1543375 RepID=UPI0018731CAC
ENLYQGVNSRLDEIQAAMLRVKLPYLEDETLRRQQIAIMYRENINNSLITLPQVVVESGHVWHLFVIRSAKREELQRWLSEQGVQTLIHYPIPPHKQQAYREWNCFSLPLTETLHQEVLSLPLDPTMSNEAVSHVINAINGFVA